MNLDNIISGRLPISLPHLTDIVLRIPTKMDIIKNQRIIDAFYNSMIKEYGKNKEQYHEIDAETELLELYPDFYKVLEDAEKEKRDIILSLEPKDTPDERFLKTPDETINMSIEEKEKYIKYYKKQYDGFYDKLLENKTIKKSIEYMEHKVLLYSKTIEHYSKEAKRTYWLVVTAEKADGKPYFEDYSEGFNLILNLPYPEYTQLIDIWDGLLDGFGLPF